MGHPLVKTDLSPMMVRYLEYKERYPDALLFFQVGDFYELFFDDAVAVARALNLTLTSRDKNAPNPIPMCGVPLAVLDGYVDRLLPLGFSVAVVTQTGSGQGVERALERFVTPGMRLFTSVQSDTSDCLVATTTIDSESRYGAIAFTDPQTGVVKVKEGIDISHLGRELASIGVREVVLPNYVNHERVDRRTGWVRGVESAVSARALRFRPEAATPTDADRFVPSELRGAVHALGGAAKRAVRLLLAYLDEISLGNMVPVREVALAQESGVVVMDAATRRNLELVQNSKDGSANGTLFSYLNNTATPGGARTLRKWILAPLRSEQAILERQEAVAELRSSSAALRRHLEGISDLERLAARVQLKVASPRDLGAIRDAVLKLPTILCEIEGCTAGLVHTLRADLAPPEQITSMLGESLVETPPHTPNEGGIFREGYDSTLDEIRGIRSTADEWRLQFEAKERVASGIPSLKVRSNNVIGFFIEIGAAHSSKVPAHYVRRQSTANAERFTTPELKQHEDAVVSAVDRQYRRELELFTALRTDLANHVDRLRHIAEALATLDALASLATVAEREALVRPEISPARTLDIVEGRHPIIAQLLEGRFIPNSISFPESGTTCFLITGPNMGGKSTYLRQTALITIMAQIGAFVPARAATIGIVDRIFARLGASDDLHEGESTFMVEMREAAHILANATERSLVLIDELGRGTATSDGLALAHAILDELVDRIMCRTLFATHYHELTEHPAHARSIENLSVGSVEEEDRVIFTHEIHPGPAPRSYGIEVAKLSGLPSAVIARAAELLAASNAREGSRREPPKQIGLFDRPTPKPPAKDPLADKVCSAVRNLDVDSLSPRAALEVLYGLCELVRSNASKDSSLKS